MAAATDWHRLRRVYMCLFIDILAVGLIVPLITPLTRELGGSPKVSVIDDAFESAGSA